jgi:hypothetical protein
VLRAIGLVIEHPESALTVLMGTVDDRNDDGIDKSRSVSDGKAEDDGTISVPVSSFWDKARFPTRSLSQEGVGCAAVGCESSSIAVGLSSTVYGALEITKMCDEGSAATETRDSKETEASMARILCLDRWSVNVNGPNVKLTICLREAEWIWGLRSVRQRRIENILERSGTVEAKVDAGGHPSKSELGRAAIRNLS